MKTTAQDSEKHNTHFLVHNADQHTSHVLERMLCWLWEITKSKLYYLWVDQSRDVRPKAPRPDKAQTKWEIGFKNSKQTGFKIDYKMLQNCL